MALQVEEFDKILSTTNAYGVGWLVQKYQPISLIAVCIFIQSYEVFTFAFNLERYIWSSKVENNSIFWIFRLTYSWL